MEERILKLRILIQVGVQDDVEKDISSLVFTKEDWVWLYNESRKQAIAGVVWRGVVKLIENGQLPFEQFPPREVDLEWQDTCGKISWANDHLERAASLLTELAEGMGLKNAVLKGTSKAGYYPDKTIRTPGDLDFWVENGKDFVNYLIDEWKVEGKFSYHHFHTTANIMHIKNIPLEVHYRPSSGCFNPIANRKIQKYLEAQVRNSRPRQTDYGHINIPSFSFNMVSELVHIRRHFVGGGIGLRHLIDYYYTFQLCPPHHNKELLQRLGLYKFWLAVASVINAFISPFPWNFSDKPNHKAGWLLLEDTLEGGNFGWYAPRQQHNVFVRLIMREWRAIRLFPVCPSEFFWYELHFWWAVLKTIPERIKRRKLSFRDE